MQLRRKNSTRRIFCQYGVYAASAMSVPLLLMGQAAGAQQQLASKTEIRNPKSSSITIVNAFGSVHDDRIGALFRFRSQIALADVVVEALQNSVPLTFVFDCQVVDRDAWFGQKTLGQTSQLIELRYHALLRHYSLKHTFTDNLEQSITDSYPTLASALTFIIAVETYAVSFKKALPETNKNKSIRLQARLRLDVDALPAPLRPYAFANNSWQVDSDWIDWALVI